MSAVPIMVRWLRDDDAQVRESGAFNLCWTPSPLAVPGLVDALQSETNAVAKKQMLEALAQTDDPRGLSLLLAAARDCRDKSTLSIIARGLSRIRDPKALPVLANMLSDLPLVWLGDADLWEGSENIDSGELRLLSDAANAFCYICHESGAHTPDGFWTGSGIDLPQLKRNVAVIQKWQKAQDK